MTHYYAQLDAALERIRAMIAERLKHEPMSVSAIRRSVAQRLRRKIAREERTK